MSSPLMNMIVKAVRAVRAAGLPRDPREAPKASERDWEGLGKDLGQAMRRFRDGKPRA